MALNGRSYLGAVKDTFSFLRELAPLVSGIAQLSSTESHIGCEIQAITVYVEFLLSMPGFTYSCTL